MPTMTVPSAAMRRLKMAAAAARSAATNDPAFRRSASDGDGRGRGHPAARQQVSSSSSGKRGATRTGGAAAEVNAAAVRFGARVLVRTAVTAPSGRVIVFQLSAVVVSAAGDDACVEVVYDGKFPPEDPSAAVRVAKELIVVDTVPPLANAAAASSACSAATAAKASRRRKKKALAVAVRKWIFSW